MSEKRFPIMIPRSNEKLYIPWDVIAPYDQRAQKNHSDQTLERLAQRGGLDPMELWSVLHDVSFSEAMKQITPEKALAYARELSKAKSSDFEVRSIPLTPEQRARLNIGSKMPKASAPSELDQALQRIARLEHTLAEVKKVMELMANLLNESTGSKEEKND